MKIADKVTSCQNVKEMTRKAIKAILSINPDDPVGIELAEDFEKSYGESV